jgi:hypothetical protein
VGFSRRRRCPVRKWLGLVVLTAFAAAPAAAQEKTVSVSVGYAFATYLEEGAGSVPLGAYLSLGSHGRKIGWAVDLAYHRDSEDVFDSIALNTFTAGVGPRFGLGSGNVKPFLQVLGALRRDSVESFSNTAFGGMAGFGVDIPAGSRVFVRLGADFQMFFDSGEDLKTLRLVAGFTF